MSREMESQGRQKLFASPGWGERMRLARRRAHLTLDEVGKALGITGGAVSRWESESSYPSRKNYEAFAQLVDVDVSWLQFAVSAKREAEGGRRIPLRSPWAPDQNLGATIEARLPCSPSAFAIEALGGTQVGWNYYQIGDIMVIDPEISPTPGDMVLQVATNGDPSLGIYWPSNSFNVMAGQFLQALKSKFGKLPPSEVNHKVLDTVEEFSRLLPRRASDRADPSSYEAETGQRILGVVVEHTRRRYGRDFNRSNIEPRTQG
jgi:transcriptional regulator with XRE-family HTH domain